MANDWRAIQPWRQIEGVRNHHVYTEYLISLFHLDLTPSGEMALYAAMARQPAAWFTTEELAKQRQLDGTTSFLDAVLADFGSEFSALWAAVPELCKDMRPSGEGEATDFSCGQPPLLRGKTGKEKALEVDLNEWERGLLFGLAWHAKGLLFDKTNSVVRYPRGWVVLDSSQLSAAETLARKLIAAGYPLLEIVADGHARIHLQPECIFLDPGVFRYTLEPRDEQADAQHWHLTLLTDELATPIGLTAPLRKTVPISRNTARIVAAIAAENDPEAEPRSKSGDIQNRHCRIGTKR